MEKKVKPNRLFSELDLFIIDNLLNKCPTCLRHLTLARGTTSNDSIKKKLDNLIELGLIKRENPKGKKINYSIKNKNGLKRLRDILDKTNKFIILNR